MNKQETDKGKARAESSTPGGQEPRSVLKDTSKVLGAFILLGGGLAAAVAASLDYWGAPPPGDPSAYTDPPTDPNAVNLAGATPANTGAFVQAGGVPGTRLTPRAGNALPPAQQTSFNIPTNGRPSPLFGAQPFTQSLLLFEEFGPVPLESNPSPAPGGFPPPKPGAAPEMDPIVAKSSP